MTIVPTVDTFEHDIADEIRHKEASIEDIASASGNIGNDPSKDIENKSSSSLMGIVIILIICGLAGAGYLGYLYFIEGPASDREKAQAIIAQEKKLKPSIDLSAVSPVLSTSVGAFLNNVEKKSEGYSIDVVSYSPVFAYMIKNEKDFADEISLAVGNSHIIKAKATSTQVVVPVSTSNATTSTSTPKTATSTKAGTTTTETTVNTEEELPTSYVFSDITISNQNMRVATSIYGTVAYAFIGTKKLVISSSPDGILKLRSSILNK